MLKFICHHNGDGEADDVGDGDDDGSDDGDGKIFL